MTLEEFRKIKARLIELINSEPSKSEEKVILAEFNKLMEELTSCDLSDIPFEEWKGMLLFNDFKGM